MDIQSIDLRPEHLIDSLEGVVYVLDPASTLIAVGRRNWNAFADANGGPELENGSSAVGRSIFDFICGDDVRTAWKRAFDYVERVKRPLRLSVRCDSPGVQRELLMIVSPVVIEDSVGSVLVQSLTMSEVVRPPLVLFDFAAMRSRRSRIPDMQVLALCSYCQNVRFPPGSHDGDGRWLAAEEYYRLGGSSQVRVSHGICPPCMEKINEAIDR